MKYTVKQIAEKSGLGVVAFSTKMGRSRGWASQIEKIPQPLVDKAAALSGLSREDIRPDIYGPPVNTFQQEAA